MDFQVLGCGHAAHAPGQFNPENGCNATHAGYVFQIPSQRGNFALQRWVTAIDQKHCQALTILLRLERFER